MTSEDVYSSEETTAVQATVQVGDEVSYHPHISHALEHHPDGSYCWSFTRLMPNGRESTLVSSDDEVRKLINSGNVAALRPHQIKHHWPARVTAVHANGYLDLDIQHPLGGVTLHCARLPFDHTGLVPHTWHQE